MNDVMATSVASLLHVREAERRGARLRAAYALSDAEQLDQRSIARDEERLVIDALVRAELEDDLRAERARLARLERSLTLTSVTAPAAARRVRRPRPRVDSARLVEELSTLHEQSQLLDRALALGRPADPSMDESPDGVIAHLAEVTADLEEQAERPRLWTPGAHVEQPRTVMVGRRRHQVWQPPRWQGLLLGAQLGAELATSDLPPSGVGVDSEDLRWWWGVAIRCDPTVSLDPESFSASASRTEVLELHDHLGDSVLSAGGDLHPPTSPLPGGTAREVVSSGTFVSRAEEAAATRPLLRPSAAHEPRPTSLASASERLPRLNLTPPHIVADHVMMTTKPPIRHLVNVSVEPVAWSELRVGLASLVTCLAGSLHLQGVTSAVQQIRVRPEDSALILGPARDDDGTPVVVLVNESLFREERGSARHLSHAVGALTAQIMDGLDESWSDHITAVRSAFVELHGQVRAGEPLWALHSAWNAWVARVVLLACAAWERWDL